MNRRNRSVLKHMVIIVYLVSIHLLLVLLLFTPGLLSKAAVKVGVGRYHGKPRSSYERVLKSQLFMDLTVPDQSVLFFGDSITQNFCVLNVTRDGVNYGIGEETTAGVAKRVGQYPSLRNARAVVIAVGINDIASSSDDRILKNHGEILSQVPPHTPVILSAILPVDEAVSPRISNKRIASLNRGLHQICSDKENCCFVNSGENLVSEDGGLRGDYHVGDGVHLDKEGYDVWGRDLKVALSACTGRRQ